ncbi:MAG: hypothetical protein Q8M31_13650 [Beijerinckiaceae bacterium]|nr:hypothetical protein [Beijerinckiaceae bacterium]
MPALRVLLTAFGSFPGAPVNPTIAIARRVERRHGRRLGWLGVEIHTATLPVIYNGAEARAADLIAAVQPHVVLHLGLAARRKRLSFETRARNRLSVLHPDARRQLSGSMLIEPQGPFAHASRAPVARCVAAILKTGAACATSIDAGDYLCNQTLYASLGGQAPVVAFLHAPRPRRLSAPCKGWARRMTIDQMAEGAFAAILEMAKAARRLKAN